MNAIAIGFGIGINAVIVFHLGAGEKERVKKIYRLTLYMTGSIMILGTILCLLASGQLIGFFTTNSETITALIAWRIYHKSVKMNADKHSPASSARSTKRRVRGGCLCQWELKAPTDRSRSDCVHEQVAKRIANVRFT